MSSFPAREGVNREIDRPLVVALATAGCFLIHGGATAPSPTSRRRTALGQVISLSTNIVVMQVEKVDKEKNLIIYRKVQDLKGKHPTDVIKHNIGRGGFHPREWQYPMDWAEVGKTAVFFHNGGASETCIGTYWYQAYAGGEWWNMSHGEPFLLRSFAGNVDKLAAAVTDIAGRQGSRRPVHGRRQQGRPAPAPGQDPAAARPA